MSNLYSSENPKKKQCIIMYCFFILPLTLYLSISLSGLTQIKLDAKHIADQVIYFLVHFIEPRKINDKTLVFIFIGIVIWLMAFVFSYSKASMKLMHGEEYGTSSWGSIKQFNKKYADSVESDNKILSESLRMTYDTRTLRNNNMFVVGGSGAGKTAFLVSPNLLNVHGSNVYTDPKGSLLEDYGEYLKHQPNTRVYSINLCEMDKSMRFNPFDFIRNESDVPRLINNIIKNTTPQENPSSADPFWEQAESMYLQAVFYYIWLECPLNETTEDSDEIYILERNFSSVLKLLDEAKVDQRTKKTAFETRLDKLKNPNHIACRTYNRMKVAAKAEETIASIILCANSRFNKFDNPDILNVLSDNDVPLDEIGTGVNYDGKTKSFVFLIIPDDDDTYNFIPGMFYTLLFQELYYQARFYPGNKLPIDVGFWFDEFANIKMPSNFEKILATCRSRKVYCVPILQSLAQIKKLFKDGAWEGIVGNCDTLIYLGGNEQSSHKYISELLGKWTIDKKTEGESKGSSGSSSKNYDVLGRDLIDASEMRLLPNDKEIVLVRGEKPLIDRKWHPWEHNIHSVARDYGDYVIEDTSKDFDDSLILNEEQMDYYERRCKTDQNVIIHDDIDIISFLSLDEDELNDDEELTDEDLKDLINKLSETDIEKMEREEAEKIREEEVNDFMYEYNDLSLVEIYSSPLCEEKRKEYIVAFGKLGIDEEIIKREVAFDIPLKTVKENLKIAQQYYELSKG